MSKYQDTILITGGTTGLGYEAALVIAKAQPTTEVVIASRSDKENAAVKINQRLKQTNVVFESLDLSVQANVRTFVAEWAKRKRAPITALILNAGLQFFSPEPVFSKDGVEMTFGVNHVGHALLFYLMRPYLRQDCRIVITASGTHDPEQKTMVPVPEFTSVEQLAHPTGDAVNIPGAKRYSTSKLCNVLWGNVLDRHLKEMQRTNPANRWTVAMFDPGLMLDTSLGRDFPAVVAWLGRNVLIHMNWLLRLFLGPNVHSAAESGAALARLAISNDVQGVSGKYYEGLVEIPSSKDSYDTTKQDQIWLDTAKFISNDDAEGERFVNLA